MNKSISPHHFFVSAGDQETYRGGAGEGPKRVVAINFYIALCAKANQNFIILGPRPPLRTEENECHEKQVLLIS